MAAAVKPDVVLMDIRMPGMDGISRHRRILAAAETRRPRCSILTTFDLDEYVFNALRPGASGFLLKDTPPERLIAAIHTVASGDILLAPIVTRRLIEAFADPAAGRRVPAAGPGPPHRAARPRCSAWSATACPTRRSPSGCR